MLQPTESGPGRSPLRIVMTAAHAGWDSEAVPVGGGGAVCERLCDAWRGRDDVQLVVVGSGPRAPAGVEYHRLAPPGGDVPPTRLSELQYARLCRRFERACTEFVLRRPAPSVVIAHDISEGPAFARLRASSVPVVLLVHVDVVEYFTRMYLRGLVSPQRAVRFFSTLRGWPVVPDVLRLVFDKQEDGVGHSARLVMPSPAMREMFTRCYPSVPRDRYTVVPWGAPQADPSPHEVAREREWLVRSWGLREGERVLLTLSRISPEKGQDRLLQAVQHAERSTASNLRVVICGAPAFMKGESFARHLRALASRLRTPVVFAGQLAGARKRAALELADVFVAASRHESYGLTTMEAYAAGTPVVAVDSHGARATVDETCGRIVPDGRRLGERLWSQIESLLRDDVLRERLADGARQRAARESFYHAAESVLAVARQVAP